MTAAVLRVGLASVLVLLVLVAAAQPKQDDEMETLSPLPQSSWKALGPWPLGGLPNVEEEDEIVVDTTGTKHGEPNTHDQAQSRAKSDFRNQSKRDSGLMCTHRLWLLSAIYFLEMVLSFEAQGMPVQSAIPDWLLPRPLDVITIQLVPLQDIRPARTPMLKTQCRLLRRTRTVGIREPAPSAIIRLRLAKIVKKTLSRSAPHWTSSRRPRLQRRWSLPARQHQPAQHLSPRHFPPASL